MSKVESNFEIISPTLIVAGGRTFDLYEDFSLVKVEISQQESCVLIIFRIDSGAQDLFVHFLVQRVVDINIDLNFQPWLPSDKKIVFVGYVERSMKLTMDRFVENKVDGIEYDFIMNFYSGLRLRVGGAAVYFQERS